MTRDETILAAMQMIKWGESEWADGEEVQYSLKQGKGSGVWTSTDNPLWNWQHYDYRIKPTPVLRPWTADEVPLGAWIRCNKTPHDLHLLGWVSVQADRDLWLNEREYSTDGGKTWLPCGVVEAGDAIVNEGWNKPHLAEAWRKAKEAKL